MSAVDPQILSLVLRRVRQLKRIKKSSTQDAIVKYVCERLEVTKDDVLAQVRLAVENGELVEKPSNPHKKYISYAFPDGRLPPTPVGKSPSPMPGARKPLRPGVKSPPPLKSPPVKNGRGRPRGSRNKSISPFKKTKSLLGGNGRPELVIEAEKDLSKNIKTALIRMERPYGSSIKVLAHYLDTKFKIKIKPAKDEERDEALHRVLLKWANNGVRRGILAKHERMFRVAPLFMYRQAPDGPITEKLQSAFTTTKKEKERATKAATPNLLCSFCMKPESENREGKLEQMVSCVTCGNSGHPSCLKWSEELTAKVLSLPSWECLECKWCSVCREAGNDGMLFCDVCDRGYHLECCEPPLTKPPKGDWACLLCLFERYDKEQMAAYLEEHKSPHRRLSASPSRLKFAGRLSARKRTNSVSKSGARKTTVDTSSDDDLPLRCSSADMSKTPTPTHSRRRGDQLIDPLSKFFTPTNKRQSTVARKSFESLMAAARERKHNRQAADKLVKRSRKELTRQTLQEKMKQQAKEKRKDSSTSDRTMTEDSLPDHCTMADVEWFNKAEKEAKQAIGSEDVFVDHGRYPPAIVFGRFQIQTWYSAPYPQEYAKLPKLWICEFCLQYAKSRSVLERHMVKCDLRTPPGNEIYRSGNLSVFEVDGQISKLYCQNLCLLAKLFLDHKTLYYDVEPFLFYVLTVNDQYGSHLAGYFSKEKHCAQKYNVSCIMILPTYQRAGYGRFLVSFSYLLSRQEKQPGTPERPLSELGRLAYQAYWRDQVLDYLVRNPDTPSLVIHDISTRTGMSPHDIAATMQELGLVRTASDGSDRLVVVVDEVQLRDYKERIANKPPIATVEPSALRWTPPPTSHSNNNSQNMAPPPVHNEYIEQLKANPPSTTAERKKKRRKRKVSPWRRRQSTTAARRKRQLERSKNEDKSDREDDEEEEDDDDDMEENSDSEEKSTKDKSESESIKDEKVTPVAKKVKRESRPRQRRMSGRLAASRKESTSSSESGEEEEEEEEEDDGEKTESETGGDSKKKRDGDDDDDGGTSNAGSGSGPSGSQNGDDASSGSTSGNGGGDTESNSGKSSYTTASDAVSEKPPAVEQVRTQLKMQVPALRPIRPRPIAPKPPKEPVEAARPSSSCSTVKSELTLKPLPSAKEIARTRRIGIKAHRVISVLAAEDLEKIINITRNTGPVARPTRPSSVSSSASSSHATNVQPNDTLMAEFTQPSCSTAASRTVAVVAPTGTSPGGVQSKVEAAMANFRKEQKVLSELAPTVSGPLATAGLDSLATLPVIPMSFFSNGFAGVDEEMSLPPPPSATVATVQQSSSVGYELLSDAPKLTMLKPISPAKRLSPPKETKSSAPVPQRSAANALNRSTASQPSSSYLPNSVAFSSNMSMQQASPAAPRPGSSFANIQPASSTAGFSQTQPLPSYQSPVPPLPSTSNFDLAAAAASLMNAQNSLLTSSLKSHLLGSNSMPNSNNMFMYNQTGSTGVSPQPAAAAVYQAIGGIYSGQGYTAQPHNVTPRPHVALQGPHQSSAWY